VRLVSRVYCFFNKAVELYHEKDQRIYVNRDAGGDSDYCAINGDINAGTKYIHIFMISMFSGRSRFSSGSWFRPN